MSELELLVGEVLEGEDLKILDRLTEREKEVAWAIFLSLRESGDYGAIADFWQLDYEVKPPTPAQFLDDPNYLRTVGRDPPPEERQ